LAKKRKVGRGFDQHKGKGPDGPGREYSGALPYTKRGKVTRKPAQKVVNHRDNGSGKPVIGFLTIKKCLRKKKRSATTRSVEETWKNFKNRALAGRILGEKNDRRELRCKS